MKLDHLKEAKTAAYGAKITQMRMKAVKIHSARQELIEELRELDDATADSNGDNGIVDQAARQTKGINDRFVHKLYAFPGDLSAAMLVKILTSLERLV